MVFDAQTAVISVSLPRTGRGLHGRLKAKAGRYRHFARGQGQGQWPLSMRGYVLHFPRNKTVPTACKQGSWNIDRERRLRQKTIAGMVCRT
jgi:hypothetical protein